MSCLVGTGATFALSTSTDVGRIASTGGFDENIASISDDDLATVGHNRYCPGGKIEHSPLELAVVFDPDNVKALGVVETGTLTFPPAEGQANGAVLAGSGFLMKRAFDGLENNTRIEGSYEFQFDGDIGPLYTAGS